jgi:hypothetical protein
MSDLIGGGRPLRFCPVCKQVDDHPRHATDLDPSDDVARHMDCCASVGCPTGTCVVQREGLAESVTGAEFLAHILSLDHDEVAAKVAAIPNDPAFRVSAPSVTLRGVDQ